MNRASISLTSNECKPGCMDRRSGTPDEKDNRTKQGKRILGRIEESLGRLILGRRILGSRILGRRILGRRILGVRKRKRPVVLKEKINEVELY